MTPNDGPPTGREIAKWGAMLLGTYLLMGVVYGLFVFVWAGESVFSGASVAVITSFVLPAFYANPARAFTTPAIGATALLASVVTVALVTRAIRHVWTSGSSAPARTRRDST